MSKIENTIEGAGVLFVKNVDSNCKIQKILPAFIFFITYIGKKRRRRSTGGSMWYMKTRGFLLKRHSFTKLQSSKKLWSTYCTPTAHELALSSLNSSSPVCSMMHGGGEYSYTTYYKPGIGSRFFAFPTTEMWISFWHLVLRQKKPP